MSDVQSQPVTAPLLHRFLGIGLVLVVLAMIIVRYSGAVPLEPAGETDLIAYALSGVSVLLIGLSLIVFRPRVPERRPGQSVAQYWAAPEVTSRVVLVWFLLEGAGVVSAVGYFLSGSSVSIVTTAVAIALFWFMGPNVFAKE